MKAQTTNEQIVGNWALQWETKMKVCIISEGSYPIVRGGVSEWTQQLIEELPSVDYDVFCIAPTGKEQPIYTKPANLDRIIIRQASQSDNHVKAKPLPKAQYAILNNSLNATLHGKAINSDEIAELLREFEPTRAWLTTEDYWMQIVDFYQTDRSDTDFSEFFWATHGIFCTLFDAMGLARQVPKADIYHALTTGLGGLVAAFAASINKKPLVTSEHGLYLKERSIDLSRQSISPETRQIATDYFMTLVRTVYSSSDFLLPICQNYADNEIALGASPEKIHVVTNGIDTHKFIPPLSRNREIPVIGCFARVVPLKDQANLIKASKKVLDIHPANFFFIGEIQDQDYYNECQTLAADLKVADNIKFIGHSNDVLSWYGKSDIFALSSQTEGLPLALLEAMSCGLPCVCTAVGGVPEVVTENGVGYIVPPGDPDTLASKISTLIADTALRKEMGAKAAKVVREKYTIEKMGQNIKEIYIKAALRGLSPKTPSKISERSKNGRA